MYTQNIVFFTVYDTAQSGARLRLLVGVWFQVYFTVLTGLLFTFPSRYQFTIDLKKYLALPVSSGRFTQAIRVLSYSRTTTKELYYFRVRDYYPLGFCFPADSANNTICDSSRFKNDVVALQPPIPPPSPVCTDGEGEIEFGLIPFRSPLLREFLLVSFPPGTEMFHFPGYAP